jgi:monoamine oxidase
LTERDFKNRLRDLYPGYDESNSGKKTKLVSWPEEEFIKTGYSCPKVGHIFTITPGLQKPLNNGRLFLTGEHTQTDFFGFMEGALRSGRRVAEQVIAKVCPGDLTDFPNV